MSNLIHHIQKQQDMAVALEALIRAIAEEGDKLTKAGRERLLYAAEAMADSLTHGLDVVTLPTDVRA